MKVAVVTLHNWANSGGNLAGALNHVGIDAVLYTAPEDNKFGYDIEICEKGEVEDADIIHVLDDAPALRVLDRMNIESTAPIVQTVNGTSFRREGLIGGVVGAAYRLDEYLHPRIVARSAVSPDLLIPGFGGQLLPNAYPVEQSPVDWEYHWPPRIVHCPSDAKKKGTSIIEAALASIRKPHRYIRTCYLPHEEIQRERDGATLYIDQIGIGWYAMAGIEAMARGIPIACYINADCGLQAPEAYTAIPVLELGHTVDTARAAFRAFFRVSRAEIEDWSAYSRDFALKNHGYQAVGQRARNIYERAVLNA